ncbi:hypothetical protein ACIGJK_27285, partial [Pseudomonas iridis]|uniref:hypothetical protein n=1 Tax=Pseudomonas iridis TaxID=2710587 RepID=UPI0037C68C85
PALCAVTGQRAPTSRLGQLPTSLRSVDNYQTDASLRSLSGRPKSLAGKSTRPAIWNDLDVIEHIVSDVFRSNTKITG